MTNQWQYIHGRSPEANVRQQYRQGTDLLVHQMLQVRGSGSHSRLFIGLIVIGTVNIWCTKQSGF